MGMMLKRFCWAVLAALSVLPVTVLAAPKPVNLLILPFEINAAEDLAYLKTEIQKVIGQNLTQGYGVLESQSMDVGVTTMTAILAALDTWLTNTHMPTTLGISVALTVTAIATVKTISRNNSGYTKNSDPAIYITGTDQFVIKGTLQWKAV
jgi:hypothetical protein